MTDPLPEPKYARSEDASPLRQGEILSDLIQVRQRLDTIGRTETAVLEEIRHPFALVLTQDCDLEGDHARRFQTSERGSLLPNILFCEAIQATELKGNVPPGKDIWKRISQNKDERYQCLELVPPDQDAAGEGIEPLGIDFKRYFTIPADEVYTRLELKQGRRRCRLVTPYVEHVATRFFYFQSRVALPHDHDVPL